MQAVAIMRAARKQALLAGVAGLLKTAGQHPRLAVKSAALKVVAHTAKQAGAEGMTKAALIAGLGRALMGLTGKGLRMGGRGMKRLGVGNLGRRVTSAGRKLTATTSHSRKLDKALAAHRAADTPRNAWTPTGQAVEDRTPKGQIPLEISKLVGAGGLGAGGYGLVSALSGSKQPKQQQLPPEVQALLAKLQASQGA